MKTDIADNQTVLKSMKRSVAKALERKRHLGQYAVVSRNGKLVRLQPDEIQPQAAAEEQAPYNSK
ncbi:MAG: hypothetical protein ACPGES_11520 [Coraliomargarita sp.]